MATSLLESCSDEFLQDKKNYDYASPQDAYNNYSGCLLYTSVIKGNIVKSKAQSKFIYVLAKPLNVSVPVLRGNAMKNGTG